MRRRLLWTDLRPGSHTFADLVAGPAASHTLHAPDACAYTGTDPTAMVKHRCVDTVANAEVTESTAISSSHHPIANAGGLVGGVH